MTVRIVIKADSSAEFKKLQETDPVFQEYQATLRDLYNQGHLKYPLPTTLSLNPLIFENFCEEESLKIVQQSLEAYSYLSDKLSGFERIYEHNYDRQNLTLLDSNFLPSVTHTISPDQLADNSFNNLGYRCPPFETVDWKESVIILGCSSAQGFSLPFEQTVGVELTKIIERPVINLGVAGSSISWVWMLSTLLENNLFQPPKAVICYYSDIHRLTVFDKNKILNLGPWILDNKEASDFHKGTVMTWGEEENSVGWAKLFQANIKKIWQKVPLIEATVFSSTSECLGIQLLPWTDWAPDGKHHGPISSKLRAALFAKQLREKDTRI